VNHRATKIKGKINEVVGKATGDREVEAQGAKQHETGHTPDADELDEAKRDVRIAHGDIGDGESHAQPSDA